MDSDSDGGRPGLSRRLAVPAAILGGLVVALVVYAGGSDLLEMLGLGGRTHTLGAYADGTPGIGKDTSDHDSLGAIPRALRSENLKADTSKKPAKVEARIDSTRIPDPSDTATILEDNVPARADAAKDGGADKPQTPAPTAPANQPQSKPDERATPSPTAPAAAQAPAKRYSVQVGATPDRAEADRLARRLKSRGVSGVSITEIRKDGASMYRVRYGAFSTEAEARTSASRNGLGEYWVVGR